MGISLYSIATPGSFFSTFVGAWRSGGRSPRCIRDSIHRDPQVPVFGVKPEQRLDEVSLHRSFIGPPFGYSRIGTAAGGDWHLRDRF